MSIFVNAVLFQLGWLFSVLNAVNGQWVLGFACVLAIIVYRLKVAENRSGEFAVMLTTLVIGFVFELIFIAGGIYSTVGNSSDQTLPPLWLLIMWPNMATSFNSSLGWLSRRYWLASFFALIGGPLAYYGADKLGAVDLTPGAMPIIAMALGWALVFPLLVWVADRILCREKRS